MNETIITSFSFGVVAAKFNPEITDRLLTNCVKTLLRAGVPRNKIFTVRVPGSYEVPWAAQEMALSKKFDVIICLGAVMKGQTPQNDHIAASTVHYLHAIALATRVPCILGVITPNTRAQAAARTKGRLDRGREAALAAIEMAKLRWGFAGISPTAEVEEDKRG